MIEATLCFLLDGRPPKRILLGRKKRGFGKGKLNGFGGKVRAGETTAETMVREVAEEAGVTVSLDALRPAGTVTFVFPYKPAFDHHVHVFLTDAWSGEIRESHEMEPFWFPIDAIPYDRMWNDDRYWLPRVLAGKRIRAEFSFAEDNETVASWSLEEA
jgi:8-oxo-dGTP diphosphatase